MSSDKQKRILIIRPDRIGDVVLSTPIPRELKYAYPDCYIGVLLREYTKDIYIHNPNVDKILVDTGETDLSYKFQLIKEIRAQNFTHAFMLLPTERMNWILFASGIKYRIGVGHKFYQFLTNTKSVYRRKYNPLRHEADYCMDSIRKIGVNTNNLDPEIHLSAGDKVLADSLKTKFMGEKKFLVGIHATSGNSVPNWKSGTYCELVNKLKVLNDVRVLVTDLQIPDELKFMDDVILPTQENLRDLIHIISTLDLLISSSTGPSHIAAALKVPTLTLFCPLAACSPRLWSPIGNMAINVLPDNDYCGKVCSGNPKQCYFEGEGGISADRVFEEVKRFIKDLQK